MSKAGDFIFAGAAATAFFTHLFLLPVGFALYLWTVILVLQLGMDVTTIGAAVLFPVIAALLLGWEHWQAAGMFDPYCVALLTYGALWLGSWLSIGLLVRAEPLPEAL